MMKKQISPRGSQAGIGLLEVLVAVLILAIGILGLAALQSITLRNSGASAERTQLVMQSYSLLDLLRANKAAAETFNTGGSFACGSYSAPNGSQTTPDARLSSWLASLQSVVPSACGKVVCAASGTDMVCTVTTRWDASRQVGGAVLREGETSTATNTQTIETTTRL